MIYPFAAEPISKRGFTLIEMLLVMVILAALASMVVPRLAGRSEQARVAAAKADIEVNIATALKLYELDNGIFPTTEQGLAALVEKPKSDPAPPNWNGPYISKVPLDPWNGPYQYMSPGTHRPHSYDLYSLGRKKKPEATDDDITNW